MNPDDAAPSDEARDPYAGSDRCSACGREATGKFKGTPYCDEHFQERAAREGIGT